MAAAKAELDGLRKPSRPFNPLTIIQIKNAERNLDSRRESQWWSVWHLVQYYSRLRLCVTASLCVGLVLVGFMVWRLPYDCQDELCGRSTHPSALPNRLKRNAHWSKTYEDIGKFSGIFFCAKLIISRWMWSSVHLWSSVPTISFSKWVSFLFGLAFPLLEQEGRRRRNKRGNSVADYIIRDSLAQALKF